MTLSQHITNVKCSPKSHHQYQSHLKIRGTFFFTFLEIRKRGTREERNQKSSEFAGFVYLS